MRFTTAWAKVSAQNLNLKVALICLSVCFTGLCLLTIKIALKEPLVIERQCYSRALKSVPPKHTEEEIRIFVQEALFTRFNSKTNPNPAYLSQEEFRSRLVEQKELETKQMNQALLVNEISIQDDQVKVDADRVISVSGIRSALSFPLIVKLGRQSRSAANPYGLILLDVETIKRKEGK